MFTRCSPTSLHQCHRRLPHGGRVYDLWYIIHSCPVLFIFSVISQLSFFVIWSSTHPSIYFTSRATVLSLYTLYFSALETVLIIHTHTQPFNGLLFGTTRVGRYQKKHSPTHTHPDHWTSFIIFLHLQRSMASSLFSLRA